MVLLLVMSYFFSINDKNYALDGALGGENACSLKHLVYWLANSHDSSSDSGSGSEDSVVRGSGSESGEDLLGPSSSGLGADSSLPVRASEVLCRQQAGSTTTDIVFPVTCI